MEGTPYEEGAGVVEAPPEAEVPEATEEAPDTQVSESEGVIVKTVEVETKVKGEKVSATCKYQVFKSVPAAIDYFEEVDDATGEVKEGSGQQEVLDLLNAQHKTNLMNKTRASLRPASAFTQLRQLVTEDPALAAVINEALRKAGKEPVLPG